MDGSHPKDLMKFRADTTLRRAIKLRAAYDDVDNQDVIVSILTAALAEEIGEIKRRGLVQDVGKYPDPQVTTKATDRKKS